MEPSPKQKETQQFLLVEFLEANMVLEGADLAEYNRLLTTEEFKDVMAMQRTFVEQELCRVVRRMLEKKFGPLSPQAVTRLESLNRLRLEDLSLNLLDARSLSELDLSADAPA